MLLLASRSPGSTSRIHRPPDHPKTTYRGRRESLRYSWAFAAILAPLTPTSECLVATFGGVRALVALAPEDLARGLNVPVDVIVLIFAEIVGVITGVLL